MASRLNASYVSILQRSCDILAIYIGLYIILKINNMVIEQKTLLAFFTVISIFQLIAGLTDFYRSWRGTTLDHELICCFKNLTITLIICYLILVSVTPIPLIIGFEYFLVVLSGMASLRVFIRLIYILFFKLFHKKTDRILVLGESSKAKKLYKDLRKSEWIGNASLGLFSFKKKNQIEGYDGSLEDVIEFVKQGDVSKIYIVIDKKNLEQTEILLELMADTTCSTIIVPELFSYNLLYSRVEDINGTPIIPLFDTRINGINTLLKRIEDICVATIILIMISPLMIIIAMAIKLTSKGPVFFRQSRYGLNGKPIKVFKFRTMRVMENGSEVKQAIKDDPRVTKIGKILRRTSLDELPQFFNVILGNMSVVGPRPHAVAHNEEYRKLITGYMLRHKVKPGITGLAQIRGWRGETDTLDKMEKRIDCDLEYIRSWSLTLDIKIIFLTIFKGFIHKSAY
ncbi:undecaprenyl-phosphate glucose phosphotransferase [Acinetobacter schindleri]|uniref:undecaprenyl-phosphate glucose phosphotransferase n=1 Tax=Acinetobacter schindleri TaxID=108981 RepID=UPI00321578EC